MPIVRKPDRQHCYEVSFGRLRLYLDDLEDIYRVLAEQCEGIKIGVGPDGEANTIDDIQDADNQALSSVRLAANKPSIVISLASYNCRGIAPNGEPEARRVIDDIGYLVQPHRRPCIRWIFYVAVLGALVLFIMGLTGDRFYPVFALAALVLLAGTGIALGLIEGTPAVIPQRRREARRSKQERRRQILLMLASGVVGFGLGLLSDLIKE